MSASHSNTFVYFIVARSGLVKIGTDLNLIVSLSQSIIAARQHISDQEAVQLDRQAEPLFSEVCEVCGKTFTGKTQIGARRAVAGHKRTH